GVLCAWRLASFLKLRPRYSAENTNLTPEGEPVAACRPIKSHRCPRYTAYRNSRNRLFSITMDHGGATAPAAWRYSPPREPTSSNRMDRTRVRVFPVYREETPNTPQISPDQRSANHARAPIGNSD